jgi:hypothetical protein
MNEKENHKQAIEKLTPIVHFNGDSKQTLLDQWKKFHEALESALEAVPETHGRNYYVKGDDSGLKARAILSPKLLQIAALKNLVEDVHGEIMDQ